MTAPYTITSVDHLGGHRLRLAFADGFVGEIDLADQFSRPRGPVFEALRDVAYFAQVTLDPELGTIVWPNGADLAPEVLHQQALSLA
jgi:hypothetical protein